MVTIVGGGRYDGLMEQLGGRPTPGIGYGMGLERVIQNVKRQEVCVSTDSRTRVMIVHIGAAAKSAGVRISSELRSAGVAATLAPSRGMRAQLRYASNAGATHALIIGDNELANGVATLRDLAQSSQSEIPLTKVSEELGSIEISRVGPGPTA